jgi:uncharacterized tellurite resistance protein B-like protein
VTLARLIDRFRTPQPQQPSPDWLRLATAAVLLEIAHADGSFTPAENEDLATYLIRTFSLDTEAARELMSSADEIRGHAIDHFALTNYIRRHAPLEDRIEIVKTMWRIAYADGRLTEYENYLVRKLADLLGLEHHVMIDAKVAVIEELRR